MTRIETAARQWSLPGGRRCTTAADPDARRRFFGHAVRWLRFVDMLEEPRATQHAHAGEVAVFVAWMRCERGWAEETIRGCRHTVDRFFDWLDERGVALASVTMTDIDQALARYHVRNYSRVTIHDYAQRLRTFFRFAARQGWCTPGLAKGIMPSRFYPSETLPKRLNRDDVLRLLATTEGHRPGDLRDRAILMLLITYGIRAGEVVGLRLNDLDWEAETLRVRRPKPRRTHLYPLSRGVAQAIVHYLREVRPPRPERTLFLTLNAPIRALSPVAISHLVTRRLDRLGITGKRRGPHPNRVGTVMLGDVTEQQTDGVAVALLGVGAEVAVRFHLLDEEPAHKVTDQMLALRHCRSPVLRRVRSARSVSTPRRGVRGSWAGKPGCRRG